MYNEDAPQDYSRKNFYILLLMGGCARISFDVLGSHDRPFMLGEI